MHRSYDIPSHIIRERRTVSYRILTAYEKAFEKFGLLLARKPLVVLLVSLTVVVASCLGFLRLSVEKPSSKHFTVTDSQSRYDLRHAAQFFPLLEARQEQIIMTPKHGQNILSEDCLKDAVLVQQTVENTSGYKNLCFRQMLPESATKKLTKQNCVISSPLELAGANFEHLSNLSSIIAREWTNPKKTLSTGESFHSSFKQMLSIFQLEYKTHPPTASFATCTEPRTKAALYVSFDNGSFLYLFSPTFLVIALAALKQFW